MQENINTQGRPTPSRRRNGRQSNKQPGQKMYASENDAAFNGHGAAYGQSPQPFTPAKPTSTTPDPYSLQESASVSKSSRMRNTGGKSRGRNAPVTSPDTPNPARKTPPNTLPAGKVATAYAGSTFHASPAPSALPIPSFLAKASASPVPTPVKEQRPGPPNPEQDAPTPSRPSFPVAQDSPLEAIFRADRAEKERARRASFASSMNGPAGLSSPSRQGFEQPNSVPRQYRGFAHERPQPPGSNSGIPISELDGASAGHVGPSFATPYHERIRAAHGRPQPAYGADAATIGPGEDPSEALKRVLFGPKAGTTWAPSPTQPAPAPSVAAAPPGARPSGVAEMEDSLRRILKLT
ncbi:hypothetical protein B0T11DRAFT_132055 [Plectosphaerella cucumerina]|uniref:Proteophosphoglycan 5 n=1 Tax=Plectosphaerella cucumerina TaxID=40658 RepID=A0A8K0TBN1_9PEZI|nr:hypothetical protein B0T11DRAFT_132055 [Plectosphaerella cucumerina]